MAIVFPQKKVFVSISTILVAIQDRGGASRAVTKNVARMKPLVQKTKPKSFFFKKRVKNYPKSSLLEEGKKTESVLLCFSKAMEFPQLFPLPWAQQKESRVPSLRKAKLWMIPCLFCWFCEGCLLCFSKAMDPSGGYLLCNNAKQWIPPI